MVYKAHMENGQVVLDEPAQIPDGVKVEVRVCLPATDATSPHAALLKFAGTAQGLPSDAAENVDHYLYGHPKR